MIGQATRHLTLHGYQQHTAKANAIAWSGGRRPTGEGVVTRTANRLATGMGKTAIAGELIAQAAAHGQRSLFLVHRHELADGAKRAIHTAAPDLSVGLVKAERNEWDADVVVASVPSIGTEAQVRRRGIPPDRFGLGIVDECHHSAAPTWRFAMEYFGAWRGVPWAGFTATLDRNDNLGLGEIWQEVVADYDISYGVLNGHLVKPRGRRIKVKNLVLDQVRRSRGDWSDGDLGEAMEAADTGGAIARAYLEHCMDVPGGRRASVVCPTIPAARHWAEDAAAAGLAVEVVLGSTTETERDAIYERFRTGVTRMIFSVGVLIEGWDAPWCDAVIMARPTGSQVLYVQAVGRGLRLFGAGGKKDCLILDVVGVSARHSLVSLSVLGLDSPGGSLYENESDDRERSAGGELVEDLNLRHYAGEELIAEEFDVFAASPSAWDQTDYGLWFIPTRDNYWYLWPGGNGSFGLGRKAVRDRAGHGVVVEKNLTMEGGMAWAEKYATEEDSTVSSRSAAWRKAKPSPKLVQLALFEGVAFGEDIRQGELSELITRRKATRLLPRPKVA